MLGPEGSQPDWALLFKYYHLGKASIGRNLAFLWFKKHQVRGQRNNTACMAFTLHVANLALVSGNTYDSLNQE